MATKAAPAAAPAPEGEEQPKSKSGLIKIILAVVVLVLLLVGTVVGTLFISGFFSKPAVNADAMIDKEAADGHGSADAKKDDGHGDAAGGHGAKDGGAATKDGDKKDAPKLNKKSPNSDRFEYSYMQIDKDFLVNVSGSRKVMSVQIAIMTRYDERVFENVKKHELAIRSAILDAMRQTTEPDISKPDFRKDLAAKVRDTMNNLLEKYEDFGGIEDVHFTGFVVQ